MNTTELKKLADDLTFHGRYGHETEDQASMRRVKRNAEASAAILKLLAINAELVEALDELSGIVQHAIDSKSTADMDSFTLQQARAALAKAEGGEL